MNAELLLSRFFRFEAELELALPEKDPEGLRDALAFVRGYLELARDHAEPLNVPAVSRLLIEVSSRIPWRNADGFERFAKRVRAIDGFFKLDSAA